jgi:hypothetical protein
MAYDFARQRIVLFAGPGYGTWLYGDPSPADAQTFGTACASSHDRPLLTSDIPYHGNPTFTLQLLSARPASVCAFVFSTTTQSFTIGPCTLYLKDPIAAVFAPSNWGGFAETPKLNVPFDTGFRGATLYAQAFVADTQAPLGVAFSAGLKLVLGD